MTNEQIKQIENLRADGCGYARIAELLSLSKNTVKSYCQRHGLSGIAAKEEPAPAQSFCRECGSPLTQMPGRKEAKFCSDTCRNAWWNAHQNMVRRKAVYEFTCAGCGRPFSAYGNANRKYCSHACYIKSRFGGCHE